MARHDFDLARFRLLFPPFADPLAYPDAYLTAKWDMSGAFISPWDGPWLHGDRLQTALMLLTAHVVDLDAQAARGAGSLSGPKASASIDKVAVAMVAPPARNGWQFWLASTPYGLQLWAILRAAAGPGPYIGGSPERAGFRKIGGRW